MKIAALLSGGVDSSVALSEAVAKYGKGSVTAFYLKIWLEDDFVRLGSCPWEEDLRYARAVCETLGVPLEIVPLQQEYWERVVSYTVSELQLGRTPSPDIFCNQRVKFGAFVEKFAAAFDRIVSGHYAVVDRDDVGVARLLRGVDPVKDQSYFLSHLTHEQIARCDFPLGSIEKSIVRDLARQRGLASCDRPDSQGICFLGKIKFREFVEMNLGKKPGNIIDGASGKVLGSHDGYWFHTIGQRKGLGLSGGPWFVVRKNIEENEIVVAHVDVQEAGHCQKFYIEDVHWIHGQPDFSVDYQCKVRHGVRLYQCHLEKVEQVNRIEVNLDTPDSGIAPGQYCIIYNDRECLGGGRITLESSLIPVERNAKTSRLN